MNWTDEPGLFVLYVTGILYWLYLPYRLCAMKMLQEEYVGRPWEFFWCLWGISFLWGLGCLVLCVPILFVLFILLMLVPPLALAIGPAGCLFLLFEILKGIRPRPQPKNTKRQSRFQFHMLDLLGFVAAYGCALALLSAYQSAAGRSEAFLFEVAALSLVLEALAFAMALNVLARLGEERSASVRLGFVTGWLIYATFFYPLALATWLAWRHALDRLENPAPAG